MNNLSILGFHLSNLTLIIFYLYPGNIFACYLQNDCKLETQITRDFIISSNYMISSNHVYAFVILSVLGIFAYRNTKKIKFLIIYLFLLSIILELLHIIIPIRAFEWKDLFGNIIGVIFVIIIYKIKSRYA
jgi:glycopeptide antibiotics resistance protein